MMVNEEAVNAAAAALCERTTGGACDDCLELARAVVEAAASHIRAQALLEAADKFGENQSIREGDVKEWLRTRAAAETQG